MKLKFTFALVLLLCALGTHAGTIVVTVTNNQFSPANINNVQVGDVIRFSFTQGFHNATSDDIPDALPAGAPRLYSGIPSSTNPRVYDYTVTTPGTYKYGCEVHASLTDFSGMVGQFTVSSVLPAILSEFKVTPTSKSSPSLSWKTLTELNVNYFSVRSSVNGIDFKEVGRVAATGNSTTPQTYTYSDDNISDSRRFIYYQIAVVDKDLKEARSDIKLFKNMASSAKLITELSPNPIRTGGHMMFQFNAEKTGQLSAKVYDGHGKLVMNQNMSAFLGINNGHLHMGGLPKGTYSINFVLDGVKDTKTVVVQ